MKLSDRYLQTKKQSMIETILPPMPTIVVLGMDSHKEELEEKESEMEQLTVDSFLSKLKSFEVLAKLLHWNTTSYSEHKTLDNLQKELSELVDTLIETAQTEELLKLCICETSVSNTALNHVKEMLDYVRMNRYILPKSFQQSQIDLVEETLSKTIYKLNILR